MYKPDNTDKNTRIFQLVLFMALSIGIFASQTAFAGSSSSIQAMAKIMMGLNHYPSDGEKETLKKIMSDGSASADEKTIAMAITNLQHKASPADKTKLSAIMDNGSAAADARTLARIIHSLNHSPSGGDVAKLEKMIH